MNNTEDFAFGVLGPLEVRLGNSPVPVRGWRERSVLAMLLLSDGNTVSVDRLVDAVWDGSPPGNALKAVRNCVSALRCRLADVGGPAIPIEAAPAGYRLRVTAGGIRLDARDFWRRVDDARRLAAAGSAATAAAGMRLALALWRGPALDGTGGRIVRNYAELLDEQRLSAMEDLLDLELALGRHRQAAAELRALAANHPLHEGIAGRLMLALYRSGRQADALDAYFRLAKQLAEDLGVDPAADITSRYEAILRHDPALEPLGAAGDRDLPGIR
jgi:DNA-binding SARP family transcriptional activator